MTVTVLAIDPGPTRSAWLILADGRVEGWAIESNLGLLLAPPVRTVDLAVIEKVEGYGMPVGAEVFETVYYSGQLAEGLRQRGVPVQRIGRKAVKAHLCGTTKAKDPNVRQALIDRFGGSAAIGRKAAPGPLYGLSGDGWGALALAVAAADGAT